ncbi:hypothetical protein KP509_26G007800 [Ceratopteris richardii]|uniref:Uncharacterized protein n=1 Tax=Ceratopteris richardii TaxID=49495 RepID=A0A8T2RJE8_CERRI|nr:hypothetical protein KP509_26G007800 [Ceratopteris richardii]
MGGTCSRKRSHDEGNGSPNVIKSLSSKWPNRSSFKMKPNISEKLCKNCPSLLEQAVSRTCETIGRYESFYALPKDLSQCLLNELIKRELLTLPVFNAFRNCSIEDVFLRDYPGIGDSWMEVIGSQGLSLLAVDITSSDVSDSGLAHIKPCTNLQILTLDYCDNISEAGLEHLAGLQNLTTLSLKRSSAITAEGMHHLAKLVNLRSLNLERCHHVTGGLCHIRDQLNLGWCNSVEDRDMKALAGLVGLQELYISRSKVSASGILCLKGMTNLHVLHMEGCHLYLFSMGTIAGNLAT